MHKRSVSVKKATLPFVVRTYFDRGEDFPIKAPIFFLICLLFASLSCFSFLFHYLSCIYSSNPSKCPHKWSSDFLFLCFLVVFLFLVLCFIKIYFAFLFICLIIISHATLKKTWRNQSEISTYLHSALHLHPMFHQLDTFWQKNLWAETLGHTQNWFCWETQ